MKTTLRKEILALRKSLPYEEYISKSHRIFETLKNFPSYQKAHTIMIYMDFNKEVKTHEILQDLIFHHKNVVVPISIPKTKTMVLSLISDPKKDLAVGTYGILEPKKERIKKIDPNDLDLILTPGVAFDPIGYRIGYGGGYYDRFFKTLNHPIPSIGLAFDLQIIKKVPTDRYDHPVDTIITETKILQCK